MPSGASRGNPVTSASIAIIIPFSKFSKSFKKCGLSVALDGSEDDQVNIEGIPNYQIPKAFGDGPEFALLDDSDEDDSGEEDNNEDYEIILNNYEEEILLVVEK